jgi:hypothetical protein
MLAGESLKQVEAEFRRVEAILDGLLEQDEQRLRSAGLQVEDRSARTYHYKNQFLFWSHVFMKDWAVDVERARVTVRLDCGEPVQPGDPARIELTWRAELFRTGQVSSIDKAGQALRSLADLQQKGIAATVMEAIAEGAAWLPEAR